MSDDEFVTIRKDEYNRLLDVESRNLREPARKRRCHEFVMVGTVRRKVRVEAEGSREEVMGLLQTAIESLGTWPFLVYRDSRVFDEEIEEFELRDE